MSQTPSQTLGPFFAYGLTPEQYGYAHRSVVDNDLTHPEADGERIRIEGRVLDGDGRPVDDALIEIWQANAHGRYNHPADGREDCRLDPNFKGFGRVGTGTDPDKKFVFFTVKPAPVRAGEAPHVNVIVLMRGLLVHAYTRIYFSDEVEANATDPVLARVDEARRETLIARRQDTPSGPVYRFDIHMQGDQETVFFDV